MCPGCWKFSAHMITVKEENFKEKNYDLTRTLEMFPMAVSQYTVYSQLHGTFVGNELVELSLHWKLGPETRDYALNVLAIMDTRFTHEQCFTKKQTSVKKSQILSFLWLHCFCALGVYSIFFKFKPVLFSGKMSKMCRMLWNYLLKKSHLKCEINTFECCNIDAEKKFVTPRIWGG